jgi:hypothetical protein
MSDKPNPQGKGLVPVLEQLAASRTRITVPPKRIDQITRELFTSLFVLESEFKFNPVQGESYWLYRRAERFCLSLVSPTEWGGPSPLGGYVGRAELHPDLTWSLELSEAAAGDTQLQQLIERRRGQLQETLQSASTVEAALPVYEGRLSFYPRLFASALAHSLRLSMRHGGLEGLSYRQACRALASSERDQE